MQKRTLSLGFGTLAFAFSLAAFFLIHYLARRPPIYGHFEIIIQICVILGFFGLLDFNSKNHSGRVSKSALGAFTISFILLIILYFYPKAINADFYMYNQISVLLFFNFRINAAAFYLLAAVYICAGLFSNSTNKSKQLYKGRNFLLIGTICFLISECSGSYWCLNWWGDSWHWSKGFLKAACVFMIVMLTFHVPRQWKLPKVMQVLVGSLPGLGGLWLLLIH